MDSSAIDGGMILESPDANLVFTRTSQGRSYPPNSLSPREGTVVLASVRPGMAVAEKGIYFVSLTTSRCPQVPTITSTSPAVSTPPPLSFTIFERARHSDGYQKDHSRHPGFSVTWDCVNAWSQDTVKAI